MKFFKKNQVIISVIALMLMAAGYLNFTNNGSDFNKTAETGSLIDSEQMAAIGDAQLVSTKPAEANEIKDESLNVTVENIIKNEIDSNEDSNKDNNKDNNKEADNKQENNTIETNSKTVTTSEYFTESRLEREKMYSQMIETYQKILEKSGISESQKTTAQSEIKKINEQKNAIMITENLIKNKGYEDLIIFVNNTSINVIIKSKKLETEQIAQVQNIITRELNSKIENIHISNKE